MNCSDAKERMATAWLSDTPDHELNEHLATCSECNAEMSTLGGLWHRLGDLPMPEPSSSLDARWQSSLDAIMAAQSTPAKPAKPKRSWSFASLWPKNPVWQGAVAFACLVIGVGAGLVGSRASQSQTAEIAKLHEEVASTRAMVALSLMQQDSATERLRGVSYTGSMRTMDPQIVSALTDAVAHDSSVNVRLAAIDALTRASGSPHVLQSLTQSLPRQDSPLVQASLVDYLVDAKDRNALGTLRNLETQPDLNPAVLERIRLAVKQLNK